MEMRKFIATRNEDGSLRVVEVESESAVVEGQRKAIFRLCDELASFRSALKAVRDAPGSEDTMKVMPQDPAFLDGWSTAVSMIDALVERLNKKEAAK